MGGNIPGRNFLGRNFPRENFQGGVWWVGIFQVEIFPGGIFLEPFKGKLQDCNFIKNRLQRRYFPLNIAKFLKTPIMKNICSVSSYLCIDSLLSSDNLLTG